MIRTITESYFEVFTFESDDPDPNSFPHHVCNICRRPVSDVPCPDHAPREVPGLQLVACTAEPRHWVWMLAGDYYEPPCPMCQVAEHAERDQLAAQCRHWPWRRWALTRKVVAWMYSLGIISGSGMSWGNGHDGCVDKVGFRGSRPYILGVHRDTWRCWLIGRHRRGEEVGFGRCGKCVPWPCCGSEHVEHAPGCREG